MSDYYLGKQNKIVREALALTNKDQRRRILKIGLSVWGRKDLKRLANLRLDFDRENPADIKKLKELLKQPDRAEKIVTMANAEQIRIILEDCLLGLERPELKRLLYLFVKEIPGFNRLIREAGGRTVVPYDVD